MPILRQIYNSANFKKNSHNDLVNSLNIVNKTKYIAENIKTSSNEIIGKYVIRRLNR